MDCNETKIDEATLGLLYLNMWEEQSTTRAWKSFDWDTLDRLHQKGFIDNPKGKAKSIVVTQEGRKKAASRIS